MKKILQCLVFAISVSLFGFVLADVQIAPVIINGTFIPALTGSGTVTSVTGSSPTSGVVVTVTNGTTTPNVAVALTNIGVSSVNATSSVVAASFSGAGTGLTGTAASLTVGNATAASSLTGTPSIAVSSVNASGTIAAASGVTVNVGGNSTGLTDLLINPTTKTSGKLIDAQVGGVSKFNVSSTGDIQGVQNYYGTNYFINGSGGIGWSNGTGIYSPSAGVVEIGNSQVSGNAGGSLLVSNITQTGSTKIQQLATPATPTGTPSTTGGSLAAGTTYVANVVALDTLGVTLPSTQSASQTTTGSTGSIAWAWTATTGAASYQIWIADTVKTPVRYYTSTTNSYLQTTQEASGTAGTIPAANTTGQLRVANQMTSYGGSVPFTLSQLSVAIGIAPTGTFVGSSTGAFTSGTALPAPWGASPFYGLYLYYPANAIGSGVPAGLYWTKCTSSTACQVYNTAYTSGQPAIPASPTAFSGQTGAVSTAPTTAVTLDSMSLPAGTLGNFGVVTDVAYWAVNSSASNKTIYFNFDGSPVINGSVTAVTAVQVMTGKVSNAGSTAAQIWMNGAFAGSSSNNSFTSHSLNTATTAAVITHTCTLALATDFCIIAQDVETVTP